jgi:hypothetical protein
MLNHFVTLYVESQRLTMWGHVVPMSIINFCCRMKCVMKLIIIEKMLFNHLVHDVLHDKVELMRSTPNTKKRTIIMHRLLKSSHNTDKMHSHILSLIRQQTRKVNLPIKTKYYQEVRDHFKHDFICTLLEH